MNGYEYGYAMHDVLINDEAGNEFICTLDSCCSLGESNEVVCTLDSNRKMPHYLAELSARERSSCRSSILVLGA